MLGHILAPLDGSLIAECVLPHVVALARVFNARITLLHVVEPEESGSFTGVSPLDWQIRRAEAKAYIQDTADRLAELDLDVDALVLDGQQARAIIEFAHDNGVELIALSSHGRSGLSGWGISSIVQKVLLRAHMPVYIVRAHAASSYDLDGLTYRQLMVALDGSQRAECAISAATTLAQTFDAGLLVAHVINRPEIPQRTPLLHEEQALIDRIIAINQVKSEQYMTEIKSHYPEFVETLVRVGNSSTVELHRIAVERHVDLMVLSAHGYSGERSWPYGSVCLNLIFYGASSLLIVQDIAVGEMAPSLAELAAREKQGH
jgi:nucleotide-binding universal stress UspA family protein